MPVSALSFTNVTKTYSTAMVLNSVSLEISHGESFAMVGINGAGKTTLLKSILDFCDLDAGKIEIYGTDHRDRRARSRVAFLPERFSPPPHLTGREFVDFMFKLEGLAYSEGQVQEMLVALDMESSALRNPVRVYSKGMAQKLGLAACLLRQKDLYILDEPMAGLDPKARTGLKNRLLHLKQQGYTLFFTSHSLTDVEEIGERMAILHRGQFRFVGTPDECCRQFNAHNLEQAFLHCIAS